MESTRLISFPKSKILISLLFLVSWNISIAFADEEVVEATTFRPPRLSAILRNIGLLHITTEQPISIEPTAEEFTASPTPVTRLPLRRRVSVRVRRLKDLNRAGRNSSFSPEILNHDESRFVQNFEPSFPRKPKRSRETKPIRSAPPLPLSKISGIDQGGTRHPGEIIRNALINHTLEHGGEQDLDKLVFSNLPNGSKLVLRTVKIIRTDGDGNPMDEEEGKQPTYWDVTLANATDSSIGDGEGEEDDEEEDSDEAEKGSGNIEEEASTREITTPEALTYVDDSATGSGNATFGVKSKRRRGRKKSDLESAGTHSAANYHPVNGYGSSDRDKEHGTTHFHGNTHGDTHKQTYTVTDGKDVKPYHGTEKGLTDYSNDHGKIKKDEGERFKTSRKKNKGRKVTGFKRVYHKEEYQRTEHFYDDEEAKKIAESFGLKEAKEADNHGTKGDKRKYQGVRTEYLDGKKHENEHGTHDGHNKGQHTTYKETEKHGHHSNYGKSHGSPPHHNSYDAAYSHNDHQNLHNHNDHPQQNNQYHHNTHQADYHPNHNYHAASYSNPKQSTIHQVPQSVVDQLRGTHDIAAIVSAPMATSFTVKEFSPLISTQTDSPVSTLNPFRAFPKEYYNRTAFTLQSQPDNQTYVSNDGINFTRRRRPFRKRQREKKMFFSPKHRFVKEDDPPTHTNTEHQQKPQIAPYDPTIPVAYQVSSVSEILNNADTDNNGQVTGENDTKYTPYAPNFGPATDSPIFIAASPGGGNGQRYNNKEREVAGTGQGSGSGRHQPYPIKTWLWPPRPRQPKRPKPTQQISYSPRQMQELLQGQGHRNHHHHSHPHHHQASRYPVIGGNNQLHLASIPFRHASALHKLGNRHSRYSTLKHNYKHPHDHQHHPRYLHPYEISTRKSDTDVDDDENSNRTASLYPPPTDENSDQYYFNHNHRYAKNHLTSTVNPVPSESNTKNNDDGNGVRNTLLDPVPGTYSTVIKVLPATMLNINSSSLQHSGSNLHHLDSKIPSVTQRPLTAADSISITTAYPHLLPQHQMHHPQQSRPFLPKPRWLTFTMNLRNPMDFKVGTEYANHGGGGGPHHQPMGPQGQPMSHPLMQGLKNGILKPFTRGPHPNLLVASPSVTPQHRFQRGPYGRAPLMMQRRPHPIFAHNMVSYNNFGGMLPLMSKQQIQSVVPPAPPKPETSPATLLVIKSDRPKFYYNYKPTNETGNQTKVEVEPESGPDPKKVPSSAESRDYSNENIVHKPTLKVSKTLAIATSSDSPTITLTPTGQPVIELQKRHSTQSPPFVTGIMDSVADFFGRMG